MAYPEVARTGRTATLTYTASFSHSPSIRINLGTYSTSTYARCPLGNISLYSTVTSGSVWAGSLEIIGKATPVTQSETSGLPPSSCTWSAECEEVLILSGGGFPLGTQAVRWRFKPGGTITATCGPLTWTATVTEAILAANFFLDEYIFSSCSAVGVATFLASYPASCSVSWTAIPAGIALTWPSVSKTDWYRADRPLTLASTSMSASGCSCSVNPQIKPADTGGDQDFHQASCQIGGNPDRPMSVKGRIYRGNNVASDATFTISTPLGTTLTTTTGSFTWSGTGIEYSHTMSALGNTPILGSYANRGALGLSIVNPPGPTPAEDGAGYTSVLLGPRKKIGTIAKQASKKWFGTGGAYGNQWTTVGGGSLITSTSSLVRVSGPDTKTLDWTKAPSGRAHTHLKMRIKRHGAGTKEITLRWMVDDTIPPPTQFCDWYLRLHGDDTWDQFEIPLYCENSGPAFHADSSPGRRFYSGPLGYFRLLGLVDGDYSVELLELLTKYPSKVHWTHDGAHGMIGMSGPAQTLVYPLGGALRAVDVLEGLDDEPTIPYASYGTGYAPGWSGVVTYAGLDVYAMSDTTKTMTPPTFEQACLSGFGKSQYLFGQGIEYTDGSGIGTDPEPFELGMDFESLEVGGGPVEPADWHPRYGTGAVDVGDIWMQWAESTLDYHAAFTGLPDWPLEFPMYFRVGYQVLPVVMDYGGEGIEGETVVLTGPRLTDPPTGPYTGHLEGITDEYGVAITQGKSPFRLPTIDDPNDPYIAVDTSPSFLGLYHIYPPTGRLWRLVFVTTPGGGALAVDSARAWLHVGLEKRIKTYRLDTGALAYEGTDFDVDQILQLWHEARGGWLYVLCQDGAEAVLFRSGDGGRTGEEVVRLVARTIQGACVGQRAQQALVFSDGNSDVWRQVVEGDSTGSPQPATFGGSQLNGRVTDLWHDERNASVLLMILKSGTAQTVYRSRDNGLTWSVLVA